MVMWTMSDRAIPRSLRMMEGFGVHTYHFVNAEGKVSFVKFHWKPAQGMQSVEWPEAVAINGADPDFHRRDLWTAIDSGDHRSGTWACRSSTRTSPTLRLRHLGLDQDHPRRGPAGAGHRPPHPGPERRQCLRGDRAGRLLHQNIIPGIDFSDDPLLQGRNFSYLDTQLKRLGGPNFTQLPVNAPRCPVMNFQRDGHMRMSRQPGRANYEAQFVRRCRPGPRADPDGGFQSVPRPLAGDGAAAAGESFADHYSQANQFWRSQTPVEQSTSSAVSPSNLASARSRRSAPGCSPTSPMSTRTW